MAQNPEQKALDTVENQQSPEQIQAKNDIIKSADDFFSKNPEKSEIVKELTPKILNALQKEYLKVDMKDIRDTKSKDKNILIQLLSMLNIKRLKVYNQDLTEWSPNFDEKVWKVKSFFEKINYKFDKEKEEIDKRKAEGKILDNESAKLDNTIAENNEDIKNQEKIIAGLRAEKKELQDRYSLQDLDAQSQNELALQKYWKTTEQLQKEIDKNQTRWKSLKVGDYLNFLNVEENLKDNPQAKNDPIYSKFKQDFQEMQSDFSFDTLRKQHDTTKRMAANVPIPAENLQNITPAQTEQIIAKTDGMDDFVGNTEQPDYNDPELEIDDSDNLETDVYKTVTDISREPHHKLETALIGRNDANLDKDSAQQLNEIDEKISDLDFFWWKDYFSQSPDQQKELKDSLQPNDQQKFNQLLQQRNEVYKNLNTNAHLSQKDFEHGQIKLSKSAAHTAKLTAVSEFMSTVADSLTQQIGDINFGEKVNIDPDKMAISEDGTRSTQIHYANTALDLKIDKYGQVQMTDLLNNGSVLEQQLEELDIGLVGLQDYIQKSEDYVKNPSNLAWALTDSTEQSGSPFTNFQQNLKNWLKSHLDSEFWSKISDNKDITKTLMSHHLSQQKAKNGLLNILKNNTDKFWLSADEFTHDQINKDKNLKSFPLLKYGLNTIETNSIADNQQLEKTFANIQSMIDLSQNSIKFDKVKNPFIKEIFGSRPMKLDKILDFAYNPDWSWLSTSNIENRQERLFFKMLDLNIVQAQNEADWWWNGNFSEKVKQINWPSWIMNLKNRVLWDLEAESKAQSREKNKQLESQSELENQQFTDNVENNINKWNLDKFLTLEQKVEATLEWWPEILTVDWDKKQIVEYQRVSLLNEAFSAEKSFAFYSKNWDKIIDIWEDKFPQLKANPTELTALISTQMTNYLQSHPDYSI